MPRTVASPRLLVGATRVCWLGRAWPLTGTNPVGPCDTGPNGLAPAAPMGKPPVVGVSGTNELPVIGGCAGIWVLTGGIALFIAAPLWSKNTGPVAVSKNPKLPPNGIIGSVNPWLPMNIGLGWGFG